MSSHSRRVTGQWGSAAALLWGWSAYFPSPGQMTPVDMDSSLQENAGGFCISLLEVIIFLLEHASLPWVRWFWGTFYPNFQRILGGVHPYCPLMMASRCTIYSCIFFTSSRSSPLNGLFSLPVLLFHFLIVLSKISSQINSLYPYPSHGSFGRIQNKSYLWVLLFEIIRRQSWHRDLFSHEQYMVAVTMVGSGHQWEMWNQNEWMIQVYIWNAL